MDLKFHIVESIIFFIKDKTKIIILGYESDLLRLIDKTSHFGIDIKMIPFAIYSPTLNDDLALFLGTLFFYMRLEPRTSWQYSIKITRSIVCIG